MSFEDSILLKRDEMVKGEILQVLDHKSIELSRLQYFQIFVLLLRNVLA
jgi:hypothetical protein